jgi:hypothetical protein
MARCAGIKRDGGKCTVTVEPPDEYCWWHDPANATQRKRAAAKGGKSKPNREVLALKDEIKLLITDVRNKKLDRNNAAVMIQGYRVLKDLVELERKVREVDEHEARIEQLEQSREGSTRWGA